MIPSNNSSPTPYRQFKANDIFENVFDDDSKVSLPEQMLLTGFSDGMHPAIPVHTSNYIFRKDILRSVIAFLMKPNGDALLVSGPTGSGKTSVITEVAARLNWPVQQITMNSRFEFSQLKGQFIVVSPSPGEAPVMRFMYGPLATAMRYGHILLLNEVDLADPGELAGLNDVLEGRPLVIPENGGEIIKPHPMFRVIATANSFGNGDQTGLYQGVQQQNLAALDRYRLLEVGYASEVAETELLKRILSPSLESIIPSMIKLANEVRKLFIGEEGGEVGQRLSITMSTRTLIRWGLLADSFRGAPNVMKFALDQALLLRAEPEDRKVIDNIGKLIFGSSWNRQPRKKKAKVGDAQASESTSASA